MSKYGHRTDNWKEAVLNKMGGEAEMDGEAAADAFLRGEFKFVRVAKQVVWKILNFVAIATASFTARHGDTVGEFFKTRSGLHVWDAFRNLMDASWLASPIQSILATKVSYYDLKNLANDFQIEKEFEDNQTPFIFENLGVFLAVLAGLILAQWNNDKEGPLLNNGYANLFYVRVGTEVVTVVALWRAGGRRWYVSACSRGVVEWLARSRVFRSN